MNVEQQISDRTSEIRCRFEENQTIIERRDFIPAILNAYDYATIKAAKSASLAITDTNNIPAKERAVFDEAVCRTIESILEFLRRYDETDSYDADYSLERIELPEL